MMIMAGLIAAGVVRILVGESESGMAHFMNGYFGGVSRHRVGADAATAAAVEIVELTTTTTTTVNSGTWAAATCSAVVVLQTNN